MSHSKKQTLGIVIGVVIVATIMVAKFFVSNTIVHLIKDIF